MCSLFIFLWSLKLKVKVLHIIQQRKSFQIENRSYWDSLDCQATQIDKHNLVASNPNCINSNLQTIQSQKFNCKQTTRKPDQIGTALIAKQTKLTNTIWMLAISTVTIQLQAVQLQNSIANKFNLPISVKRTLGLVW